MVKNFLIVLKKSTTDAIKTASKIAIQKTAKVTGDLIGNSKVFRKNLIIIIMIIIITIIIIIKAST